MRFWHSLKRMEPNNIFIYTNLETNLIDFHFQLDKDSPGDYNRVIGFFFAVADLEDKPLG